MLGAGFGYERGLADVGSALLSFGPISVWIMELISV